MSSSNPELAATAAAPPTAPNDGSNNPEVNSFIESLHLERSNTRAVGRATSSSGGGPTSLQRRKTLHKQAKDPKIDQEALEQEIFQMERLASLLGRRPTKFDHHRLQRKPTVNHDLDVTLEGFFNFHDDDEHVADVLLSGSHSSGKEGGSQVSGMIDDDGDGDGGGQDDGSDPVLKQQSTYAVPSTLTPSPQTELAMDNEDPFDRIEEMNNEHSASGSAEYLPLDEYDSDKEEHEVAGSKDMGMGTRANSWLKDNDGDGDDNDQRMLGFSRSQTWKRESAQLIQERGIYGPAVPQVEDNDEEEEEEDDEEEENLAPVPTQNDLTETKQPAANSKSSGEEAFISGAYTPAAGSSNARNTTYSDYAGMLDYIDELTESSESEWGQSDDEDDGHISSDLLDNSGSDSSDINLSDDDNETNSLSSSSQDDDAVKEHEKGSSDSDSRYLSRITQPRRFALANVVDNADEDDPSVSADDKLNPHSTHLRRSRDLRSRSRSARNGSLNRQRNQGASSLTTPAMASVLSADAVSSLKSNEAMGSKLNRWSGDAADNNNTVPLSAPPKYSHSSFDQPEATPGLAKLAEDVQAASSQQKQLSSPSATSRVGGYHQRQIETTAPDRLARTLEASDAASTVVSTATSRSNSVNAPPLPPLPNKARPKVPRNLGGGQLNSSATIAAAMDRPSAPTLFSGAVVIGETSVPQVEQEQMPSTRQTLLDWLQRTDSLLPADSKPKALPLAPQTSSSGTGDGMLMKSAASFSIANNATNNSGSSVVWKRGASAHGRPMAAKKSGANPQSTRPAALSSTSQPISSNSSIRSSISFKTNSPATASPALQPQQQQMSSRPVSIINSVSARQSMDQPSSPAYHYPQNPHGQDDPAHHPCLYPQQPSGAPHGMLPMQYQQNFGIVPHILPPSNAPYYDVPPPPQQQQQPPVEYQSNSAPFLVTEDAPFGAVMVEPSAPMLPGLSSPELPGELSIVSPHTYAFPMPMHYSYSQQPQAPKLPEKPRPYMLQNTERPRPTSVPDAEAYSAPVLSTNAQQQQQQQPAPATADYMISSHTINVHTLSTMPPQEYVMVEDEEKARLNYIINEYSQMDYAPSIAAPAVTANPATNFLSIDDGVSNKPPLRSTSLASKPLPPDPSSNSSSPSPVIDALNARPQSLNTHVSGSTGRRTSPSGTTKELPTPNAADATATPPDLSNGSPGAKGASVIRKEEIKRKAALFEILTTERSYTNDLRIMVELFLLPIQLLGNRKIVEVIFSDLIKITEMNSMMYTDLIKRMGPLAALADPEHANRIRKKKKSKAMRGGGGGSRFSSMGPARSALHGSSLKSLASPTTLSDHRQNSMASATERTALAAGNGGDNTSIATSNSGSTGGDGGYRYLSHAPSTGVAERHDSVRSSMGSISDDDEDDATKWTEDQVLDYFKNVCIGDVLANYLKDFPDYYGNYSANQEKAVEYLSLVRETSTKLNLRSDATRDAHQRLLQTLEKSEKDPRMRRLPLETFLLSPVQRITRYGILLEALLKLTPEDHPDHGDIALSLSISKSVATEVDRKKEEIANRHRLAELQSTFNWVYLLKGVHLKLDTYTKLVGHRKFIRKGPLRKASSGKHLYAILFNDFLMLTASERRGGVWNYEPYRLPIQTYDLLARQPVKDQFELVDLKSRNVYTLRADTPKDAADWVKDIMKTANYCYDVMCDALKSGIQVSKVKSVISPEQRASILQGGKPPSLTK